MSDVYKDYLTNFHELGIYYPNKITEIFGEIDDDLHNKFIKNMYVLNRASGKIRILVDSVGGDVHKAMSMHTCISHSDNEVETIIVGEASSSTAWIIQAADKRSIYSTASILLHIGEVEYPGSHPRNHKEWSRYNDKVVKAWMINTLFEKIVEKKPRFTKKKLEDLLLFDRILTPAEALEYNLVDEIIE